MPAQLVGGAGEDVQQVPLRKPVMHSLFQLERLLAPLGTFPAAQDGAPALQNEIGIARVVGVHPGGGLGQEPLVVAGQLGCLRREAGLGAELLHQRRALLPGHQLVLQVGVGI
ncbi:hypothetical protein OHA77_40030 [Streptosporangium sp. NBC_01639]|uniref:hypothetical protein n=1 Tax=Streptosporangium sp. NBC_01639 TaxID=2975948 RepID=UPI003867E3E3|nr:hypothetical protein OHA77_40030 [Streptosporangium sp. NBC_01639]